MPLPDEPGPKSPQELSRSGEAQSLGRGETPWVGLVEDLRGASLSSVDSAALSERHGVSQEFVEDVIAGASAGTRSRDFWGGEFWDHLGRLLLVVLTETRKGVSSAWKTLAGRPPLLIIGTTLILAILFHAAFWTAGLYRSAPSGSIVFGFRGLPSLFFIISFGSHLAASFTWASYKRAMWASALLFVLLLPGWLVRSTEATTTAAASQAFLLAIGVISLLHLGAGSMAAFLGSLAHLRREARDERKLTRQEMLARLFDLDGALRRAMASGRPLARRRSFKEWARQSSSFPLWGVLYGLGFGILEVLMVGSLWMLLPREAQTTANSLGPIQGLLNVVALALIWVLSYYAGGAWRGVMAAVIASGGRLLSTLFPFGPYGLSFLRSEFRGELLYLLLLAAALAGAFGGAAGLVDRKMAKGRRLRNNDPAALVAEMVRLERRLRGGSQGACVMAVDVARSTMIKADADPLAVEFSFRGYQDLVAQIVQDCGGEVFSTAGDGALASFTSPHDALHAAKVVQSRIYEFNDHVNRLDHPFRLRIGLHAGHTQAEFSEAPFNELIDVAAHVESVSPVGGIACTEAFRLLVADEQMAEVAARVDGHRVWIVLSPILSDL
jgi:class 3 adenylate cyclase